MSDFAYAAALNRLSKWKALFAGWQLGTRPKGDPECDAVRDHREATLMLRAENNAIIALLVAKGIFTAAELKDAVTAECELFNTDLETRFPGVRAGDLGLLFDTRAEEWMSKWKP